MEDRCVCCGAVIPEGRQVCLICDKKIYGNGTGGQKMRKPNQRQKALSKEQSKIRVLAIAKMLNEGNRMTATQILRRLELQYDIIADRRTIYHDVYAIDKVMPIDVATGRFGGYKKCCF